MACINQVEGLGTERKSATTFGRLEYSQSLVITHPKKWNLQLFQSYKTIPIKVVLMITLNNRLQPQSGEGKWAASWQNQQSGMCAQRRLRSAWPDSSLCAQWVDKDPSFLHADSEDSDQTGRMPRLIWVFAGRTATLLVFSWGGLISNAERPACVRKGRSVTEHLFLRQIPAITAESLPCLVFIRVQESLTLAIIYHGQLWGIQHQCWHHTSRKSIRNSSAHSVNLIHGIGRGVPNVWKRPRVLFNGSTGDRFRTTVGFRQPTLLYHLPQKENHGVSAKEAALLPVSAKEAALLPTSVLQNSEQEQEADVLQDRLDTNKGYKMKLGPDKTKVMTNNQNDFQREISK